VFQLQQLTDIAIQEPKPHQDPATIKTKKEKNKKNKKNQGDGALR